MKIKILRCKGGWYWKIIARNGRTLCHSEVYKTKQGAEKGARVVWDLTVDVKLEG